MRACKAYISTIKQECRASIKDPNDNTYAVWARFQGHARDFEVMRLNDKIEVSSAKFRIEQLATILSIEIEEAGKYIAACKGELATIFI